MTGKQRAFSTWPHELRMAFRACIDEAGGAVTDYSGHGVTVQTPRYSSPTSDDDGPETINRIARRFGLTHTGTIHVHLEIGTAAQRAKDERFEHPGRYWGGPGRRLDGFVPR